MRRRRTKKPISDINVVPYLDVLLVLLVIFIITTPLLNQGTVDLPDVGDTPVKQASEAELEVIYRADEQPPYQLKSYRAGGSESEQLTLDGLMVKLRQDRLLHESENPYIIISADRKITHGDVVALLGRLQGTGYKVAVVVEGAGQ